MPTHFWHVQYRAGLAHIKAAIEDGLALAGANMVASSVFLPKKYLQSGLPAWMGIAAVPCDAPKFVVKFTRQEIIDCAAGVTGDDVREKISSYALAYTGYRTDPHRSVRPLSTTK
jgi:hypothetical protein